MARAASPQPVAAVRRFTRCYTRQIGLLQETLLRSPFALTEARVLYELGNRAPTHATALGQELGLDAGYLSRILRGFERRGLLERTPSKTDGRQNVLALTGQGRNVFARLDGASRREIGTLVAQIVARFIKRYDSKRERCWIAEIEGEIVGSVFLVRWSDRVAQLRLLLVEPHARGLGIGARLVRECLGFARRAGYRKIMLWTNDVLHAARHIYEQADFHLVCEAR